MRLICVTDNCVARGSSLWGEHGLCFWVETDQGAVLWDTGQTATVLFHNLRALSLEDRAVVALGLSHAHYDHTGALTAFLERHPGMQVYGNASLFEPRYARSGERVRAIGLPGVPDDWHALAAFSLSDAPQEILPGVRTTGCIAPRPYPQGSSPHHVVERSGDLRPDPYGDDMSLVLQVTGGIVLLCGCCHAGLRNTLATLRAQTRKPLLSIIGGTHLADAEDGEFTALIEVLKREGSPRLHLNHCTGERAIYALHAAFGERVSPCPAGTTITFD
jgi:7,8-dihydropterin-6-yl-methyl-4-(beta-D-ribofuranosyl)aminobenzene 5'-phosphate synthase